MSVLPSPRSGSPAYRFRETGAAHVVAEFSARERVQLLGQRRDERMLPLEFEPAVEAVEPQDVDRAVAHNVVGNASIRRRSSRHSCIWHVHRCIFPINSLRHNRSGGGGPARGHGSLSLWSAGCLPDVSDARRLLHDGTHSD